MHATTVGVDLAKRVFEIAVADGDWRIRERQRLSRGRFGGWFGNRPPCRVVMEACGSAHHWARTLAAQGHEPVLLPAQYVRAYVKRNKTDAADAGALIEAARCAEIRPVPVKSIEQQAIQQLHRLRAQCMGTRTARINWLRGVLREVGVCLPVGARRGLAAVRETLAAAEPAVPALLRPCIEDTLTEIAALEQRCTRIERELASLTREDGVVRALLGVPGIGPLTATALRAAVVDVQRFPSGRHLAS
jgi:transposase